MNIRQTARNRSEYEIDNITDEERDRERDTYERQLEQDEDKARRTDRRKSRDAMSRRVTGAEQPTSKSILGYKRLLQGEAKVRGTPRSIHTWQPSARMPTYRWGPAARRQEPGTGAPSHRQTQTQPPASDKAQVLREQRRLFTDLDIMADIFRGATEEVEPEEIGGLIAAMNPQQLAASLQHMALKWRELKGGDTGGTRTCRPSASDSQLQ